MKRRDHGWTVLDHTADAMVEVWGETFEKFCWSAVDALNHFLGSPDSEAPETSLSMDISGTTQEEKVVNLLRELLYHFAISSRIVTKLMISGLTDYGMSVEVFFKNAVISQDSVEIKGITYHGLSIQHNDQGFSGKFIFDI